LSGDKQELKPCPFCGGIVFVSIEPNNTAYFDCSGDRCEFDVYIWSPLEEAIEAWNTRHEN
jgi:hypothetical protein